MSSIARQIRRGKRDSLGRKFPKRPYNNKKRTKGRKRQEDNKKRYEEILSRGRYIRALSVRMIENKEKLTDDNWLEILRKYDKELFIDPLELKILFKLVNK